MRMRSTLTQNYVPDAFRIPKRSAMPARPPNREAVWPPPPGHLAGSLAREARAGASYGAHVPWVVHGSAFIDMGGVEVPHQAGQHPAECSAHRPHRFREGGIWARGWSAAIRLSPWWFWAEMNGILTTPASARRTGRRPPDHLRQDNQCSRVSP